MPDNESQQLTVTGLAVDGAGVGRLADGRVTFIDGALPGDVVTVSPRRSARRVVFSALDVLVEPSPGRVPRGCDIEACGGCPLRSAHLDLQAEHKRRRLLETLRRIGGVDVDHLLGPGLSVGSGWAYRHRVRLHARFGSGDGGDGAAAGFWQLGYHRRGSQQVVALSTCPVVWPELERAARRLASSLAGLPQAAQLREAEVVYSRRDGRAGARLTADGPLSTFRESLAWVEASELKGVEIQAADGRLRWGNLALRYDHAAADAFDLRFEPGLFTQAHPAANDALVAYVMGQILPRSGLKILELHAGIGNFTLPLARAGASVIAVEQQIRAAQMLESNARAAATLVSVRPERDTAALDELSHGIDVLLLDPSRQGAREVMNHLVENPATRPQRVIYVSCDPGTLARDTRLAADAGFQLVACAGFDLFPQTPHVEAVATFERT